MSVLTFDSMAVLERTLPWVDQVKYFGVILDKRLTFKPHIEGIKRKFTYVRTLLDSLLCRGSALDLGSKITLYKTVLRPQLNYVALV